MSRLVNDLIQIGSRSKEGILSLTRVGEWTTTYCQGHLACVTGLPGHEIEILAGNLSLGRRLACSRRQVLKRGQGLPGHGGKGRIRLLSQSIELIQGIQAQRRQQLVASDQELQLGDAYHELLLGDVRLVVHHLVQAGIPIELDECIGRGSDGDDRAIIAWWEAEQVPQLSLGRDDVRGPRDLVEVELFESLRGLGDIGHGATACQQVSLLAIEDFLPC